MKLTDEQKDAMSKYGIPDEMHGGIIRYFENGIPPGSFLCAVINNDLQEAVARADDTNLYRLRNYVQWFYNYAPSGAWGYPGAVSDWCKKVQAA